LVAEEVAKTNLINSVAAINGAAIGFFVLAALYELLHTDVEAAVALFRNDDAMEASAMATAVELFLRLPLDALHHYEDLVSVNPIFYKACTSGVAYTVGDFVSQVYQGRTLETLDLKRSARSGTAGFIGHGPLCHFWMKFMEANLDFGGAWWGTGFKVLADQTVWSVYLNAMYSGLIGALALRDPKEVWSDIKATSWPALRTSWRFWPFVHAVSFSHAVPLDLKLLWVDAMEVVWVTLLSKVANDDKEAGRAAVAEAEAMAEEGGGAVGASGDEGGELAVEPVSLPELGVDVVNPAVDLVRVIELEQALAFENAVEEAYANEDGALELADLPKAPTSTLEELGAVPANPLLAPKANSFAQEVLVNAWPLVAMWPFLFATYSAGIALGLDKAAA